MLNCCNLLPIFKIISVYELLEIKKKKKKETDALPPLLYVAGKVVLHSVPVPSRLMLPIVYVCRIHVCCNNDRCALYSTKNLRLFEIFLVM